MVDKKKKTSSNESNKKIIAIVAAIIVIIILLFSLVSCNKNTTDKDTKERKVIEEKNKKKKDSESKDKEETTTEEVAETEEVVEEVVCVRPRIQNMYNNPITSQKSDFPIKQPTIRPTKYETVVLLVGDETINLEYTVDSYNERGAVYYNKNNVNSSNGTIENGTIYYDGQEVESIDNTQVGEYKVVYTYTNPDKVTITKTRTVNVVDTVAPTATAIGYIENGEYVVVLSDLSETLSDWDETNTKVFAEKQDTVTITDVNGNVSDIEVTYEKDAPVIAGTKSETSSYISTYTFTVTDQSDIAEVKVGNIILDPDNNYEYTSYVNETYTVTATDALGNVGTYEVIVEGVKDLALTEDEVTKAVTTGATRNVKQPTLIDWSRIDEKDIIINNTTDADGAEVKVVAMKYSSFATRQLGITTDSFKNDYVNLTKVHTADVTTGFTAVRNTLDATKNRYYYVYYEVEKTYPGKEPVKQANVIVVDVAE